MQESVTLITIILFLSDAEKLYEALMQGNGFELHNRIIFDSDATCADPCVLCSILVDRMSKEIINTADNMIIEHLLLSSW